MDGLCVLLNCYNFKILPHTNVNKISTNRNHHHNIPALDGNPDADETNLRLKAIILRTEHRHKENG